MWGRGPLNREGEQPGPPRPGNHCSSGAHRLGASLGLRVCSRNWVGWDGGRAKGCPGRCPCPGPFPFILLMTAKPPSAQSTLGNQARCLAPVCRWKRRPHGQLRPLGATAVFSAVLPGVRAGVADVECLMSAHGSDKNTHALGV